ncbi:hypothetical protein FWK35_00018530 [Aphis craccivora]|uniref:Uncharacterized protein n=1 Tax=Aphis craccivora TaxID=307492 RepID=A0A6G0YJV1_APHCR|nr:hypothetical protein FWK35_00018530 [Aphis craccivora]
MLVSSRYTVKFLSKTRKFASILKLKNHKNFCVYN